MKHFARTVAEGDVAELDLVVQTGQRFRMGRFLDGILAKNGYYKRLNDMQSLN